MNGAGSDTEWGASSGGGGIGGSSRIKRTVARAGEISRRLQMTVCPAETRDQRYLGRIQRQPNVLPNSITRLFRFKASVLYNRFASEHSAVPKVFRYPLFSSQHWCRSQQRRHLNSPDGEIAKQPVSGPACVGLVTFLLLFLLLGKRILRLSY